MGDSTRTDEMLSAVQREVFEYFRVHTDPATGLVPDSTQPGKPCSIAAVGLALAAYPVAIERAFISRAEAVTRVLATLRFFRDSPQGTEPNATGYRGFYYHFLHMKSGRRAWKCELSTIDTALLLAGMLTVARYFNGDDASEREIRGVADELYLRADWQWAQNGEAAVTMGWTPEKGFLRHRWQGYNEALILYVLGLGSPTYPLPPQSYAAWTATYKWMKIYGQEMLFAGPLFIHQFSHLWIDFRAIQDDFMRARQSDYFENSRRATCLHRQYSARNPRRHNGYGEHAWGLTASEGPSRLVRKVAGQSRRFFPYKSRGAPYGPDDGTVALWCAATSLPFAPEIVLPLMKKAHCDAATSWQLTTTFNPTFPTRDGGGWISPWHYGINLGPLLLMIENYRTGQLWQLMRECPHLTRGLRRAGFRGGWLD